MKKITKMKNTMTTLTIALAMTIIASCSKSESETCTWSNSYLAGKTYLTTKVELGTGSSKDSLEMFVKLTFTNDSIKSEYYNRKPIQFGSIAYTASTINGINNLTTTNGSVNIDNFSCTGFTYLTGGNEPFKLTYTKQ